MKSLTNKAILVALVLLVLVNVGGIPGGGSAQITSATYVYEKDQSGGVPPGVQYALGEINKAGKVSAAAIEADVKDATGNTPPQYKVAVEKAKEVGLPSLVVQAGEKVVKVVKSTKDSPLTEEQVLEAVQ